MYNFTLTQFGLSANVLWNFIKEVVQNSMLSRDRADDVSK